MIQEIAFWYAVGFGAGSLLALIGIAAIALISWLRGTDDMTWM